MTKGFLILLFSVLMTSPAWAQNLYETLGVPATATAKEIKTTWKKLVRENHPDRYMDDPVAAKVANEKLALINAAETVLGNETLRAYYDYLSYRGQQHERWARTPENQNAKTLEKRFGSVDFVMTKTTVQSVVRPAQSARPQARPQPQQPQPQAKKPEAQPTPKPEPEPVKPKPDPVTPKPKAEESTTRESLINQFKQNIFHSKQHGNLAVVYLKQNPLETSVTAQLEVLNLLRLPLHEVNLESIAFIVARTFEVQDSAVLENVHQLLLSKNPTFKKLAVALLQYTLESHRTEHIFKLQSASAEGLLINLLNDSDPSVRTRTERAVEKLNIKITKNYDALDIIAKLNSTNDQVRNQSYQDIFQVKNFTNEELKSLVEILVHKRLSYELIADHQLLMEMTTIIEVLESVPDLTVVADDFKKFRNNILGKDLVLRSYALEQKIEKMSLQHRVCSKVFN